MTDVVLTEQEKTAFCPEITRNRALGYFYAFDNVPLQFFYKDKLIRGEMGDLEKRNKAITETLWLDAYHQYLVANAVYAYFYRGSVLQMVFATHQFGAGTFSPPAPETRPFVPTAEGVQANFEAWMEKTGHRLAEEQRKQPPRASWASLLGVPDRTVRIESLIPIGNQVLIELISSWTEDGVLKETAWVVVALYDTDGTVLQDRSYIDLLNWPSARRYAQQRQGTPSGRPPIVGQGVMDKFYAYHRSRQIDGAALTDMEKRNLATIQGPWLDAYNTDLDTKPFHAPRFRLQLPCQKCSCNLIVATEVETIIRRAAPDRKMRLGMTYARGNQAVAEGIVSWTEDGVARESPFISFFVLDAEGKIIRDRRYITMANWPGADSMAARLGL